jgi:hypothetical protein
MVPRAVGVTATVTALARAGQYDAEDPAGRPLAAPREEADLAEDLHVDHGDAGVAPDRRAREPFGRAPDADHARKPAARREEPGLGELLNQRSRKDDGVCVDLAALLGEGRLIEGMVQRQRPADQQPRHQRHRKARERRHGQSRQDNRVLAQPAFQGQRRPPAISSAWLRATGTRPAAVTSQVMTARCAPGPAAARARSRARDRPAGRDEIVERDEAVWRIAPVAADVAHGKDIGRDLLARIEMIGLPTRP